MNTRERIAAYNKAWREAHPEYSSVYNKKWRAAHPGHMLRYEHATGRSRPMSEAKDSASYLGVHIAERVLSKYFRHVERMPINNHGFDFICDKGFKVDAKCACLRRGTHDGRRWDIKILQNTVADYFFILLFNNREDLDPIHVYLVPGKILCHLKHTTISNSPKGLAKWSRYEKPVEKVIACCNILKAGGEI